MEQVILGMLAVQTLFVLLGGSYVLWQRGALARWRVNTFAAPVAQRRRRARRVDQLSLCRVSRLYWHHQRRFAEMKRETKPETSLETASLTEVRPVPLAHDPKMLALALLVRAKLVTQTAGLEVLYGVSAGGTREYQQRAAEFRAALAHVNLHGSATPPTAQRDTETRRASAA